MTGQTNQALSDALKFMSLDKVPLMKELTARYKKIALQCHPDKNFGSKEATEAYQELAQSFRIIADYIVENSDNSDKENNDEEKDIIHVYKSANVDKKNCYSHTIYVENAMTNSWKHVLKEKLVNPKDSGDNGLIHTYRWNFGSIRPKITVTLYMVPKNDNRSKLHVQGTPELVDIYCKIKIPHLYAEVRKHHQNILGITSDISASNPKERESKPRSVNKGREPSGPKITVQKHIQEHRINQKKDKYDERRNLEDTIEVMEEEVITVQVEVDVHNTEETFDRNQVNPIEEIIEEAINVVEQNPATESSVTLDEIVLEEPVAQIDPDSSPTPEQLLPQLGQNIEGKDKIIEDLEKKVASLEKKNRELEKNLKVMTSDTAAIDKQHKEAIEQLGKYCNENTELKSQLLDYKKHEASNSELLKINNNLKKRVAELEKRKADDDETEDMENIQVLAQNLLSRCRRTTPSAPPRRVSVPAAGSSLPVFTCSWASCNYKTKVENRLQGHIEWRHKEKCDICSSSFETAYDLRLHLRDAHHKVNGSMKQCTTCQFSALNDRHLRRHIALHHKEAPVGANKKNITCKYWARGNCRRGLSCHFDHPKPAGNQQRHGVRSQRTASQSNYSAPRAPWSNPAFSNQDTFNQQFPFLGQCQNSCCKRGRGF